MTYTPPVSGTFLWARGVGSAGIDASYALTNDYNGNILVGGTYNQGPYLAKRSSAEVEVWGNRLSSGVGSVNSIITDSSGNIYMTGNYYGFISIAGGYTLLGNTLGHDIFVIKLDSNGNHVWSKTFGGTDGEGDLVVEAGYAIALDPIDGNIVVTGIFSSPVNFGSGIFDNPPGSGQDSFLVKLSSSDGSHIWSKHIRGSIFGSTVASKAMTVDSFGNIFITGKVTGQVDFGGATINPPGTSIFVSKYSGSTGTLTTGWPKIFGGNGAIGSGIVTDGLGGIVLVGTVSGTMNFGGQATAYSGYSDIVVAKLSAIDGSHIWSRGFGGTSVEVGNGITTDSSGNIFITGRMSSVTNFGGGPLALYSGGYNGYVASFTPSGIHRWSTNFNTGFGNSSVVHISNLGQLFIAGQFSSTANFGGGNTIPAIGSTDIFIASFAP